MSNQVLAFVASAAIAIAAGRFLGRWAHRALYRMSLMARISTSDRAILRLEGPIGVLVGTIAWELATSAFSLAPDSLVFARTVGSIGVLVALAWAGMRVVDTGIETIGVRSTWISGQPVSQSLLPTARRVARVAIGAIAAVMILAILGFSVSALVVGLAVVGVAVALGARKTLEDVFAAFAIGVDHPFREGDFIRLSDGTMGTVEAIGLRSTRLRTIDRTVVTIPNGKLADAQIEALTERDRVRFDVKLKLEIGASTTQLERVLSDLRDLLRAHPHGSPESPSVHLVAIADSWFELEAMAWFQATWPEFEAIRDRLFISCLEVIARAGVTLHGAPNPPIARPERATARTTATWPVGDAS